MAALLIYIFVIILLKNNNNNPIMGNVSFYDIIMNIPLLISSTFTQFTTPLPFIDISYKLFNLLLVLIAIFSLINKNVSAAAAASAATTEIHMPSNPRTSGKSKTAAI